MDWTWILIVAGAVAAVFLLKRMSLISASAAGQLLKNGASIIDVRSREEFRRGEAPGAINIPLDALRADLPGRIKDQNQPLLVYCLSGGRSALAKRQLKSMGYAKVFNLGSLNRARQIVLSVHNGTAGSHKR